MNVVHIITGLGDGGAEAVLFRLCSSDQSDNHHVISLMDDGKYGSLLREIGIEVDCLNMSAGRISAVGIWRLWRLLRVKRPDVVQTWMYHANLIGGILARLAGVRRIVWGIHHTSLGTEDSKGSTRLVSKLCAWLSGVVPVRIVCCAEEALRVHKDLGYAKNKLLVIPNGYDFTYFYPNLELRSRLRAEWGIGGRWLIGMVGRFDPPKDHRTLLEAMSLIVEQGLDCVAVLVGSDVDNTNTDLVRWVREFNLGGRVCLLGQRSDIPAVMNALDVHVLSSAGEAFPNVVVEAMACGTPVVVSDVGDAATIIGDTGWVVPSSNADSLATALMKAHGGTQDVEGWRRRQKAARQRVVDSYDLNKMVGRYREVWEIRY